MSLVQNNSEDGPVAKPRVKGGALELMLKDGYRWPRLKGQD